MAIIKLSPQHQQSYQELQQGLEALHQLATQTPIDPKMLKLQLGKVQQLLGDQIRSLEADHLAPATPSQVQSYLTEIHRQFRLLEIDVTFWQASRQPATAHKRQTQLRDRIQILINYCSSLLNPSPSETTGGEQNS